MQNGYVAYKHVVICNDCLRTCSDDRLDRVIVSLHRLVNVVQIDERTGYLFWRPISASPRLPESIESFI